MDSIHYFLYTSILWAAADDERTLRRQTPVMGFNTWNSFRCDINETLIIETTDLLISTGLASSGYRYVNIDDCWSLKERDVNTGNILYDPEKFPNGLKYIADYIHTKHLKFGLYSDAGTMTCAGYPGSVGHEEMDAQLFINEYDIDLLKYDWCYNRKSDNINTSFTGFIDYETMGNALKKYGDNRHKHIVYSLCNWGRIAVKYWGNKLGDSWRISGDIFAFFDFKQRWEQCLSKMKWCHLSVMEVIDEAINYYDEVSCGHFMDLDMMVMGFYDGMSIGERGTFYNKIGGLTYYEQETHFILWCLYQSPLIIGYDLRKIDDIIVRLLKHQTLIDINQDLLCKPPKMVKTIGDDYQNSIQLFLKHLYDKNTKILNVLNRDNEVHSDVRIYFRWIIDELYVSKNDKYNVKLNIYDIMGNEDIGVFYCCDDFSEYFVIHKMDVHQSMLYRIEMIHGNHNNINMNVIDKVCIVIVLIAIILFCSKDYLKSTLNQNCRKKRSNGGATKEEKFKLISVELK